jgi:fatty acid amide hydrolase
MSMAAELAASTSPPPGASELARLIARGELSAREAVEAHVRRIEEVNGRLNALVVPRFDEAVAEADAADAARSRGAALGSLHGVPVTIKECIDLAGHPSTAGVVARTGQLAGEDAPIVRRLRGAGAIVLGKTNDAQLLLFVETDNPVYGRTSNPWRDDRSAGGSSGGEAAIVAARGSPLGIGTDIAGSVRVPAHACGIHALKPTAGRLPLRGTGEIFRGQEAVLDAPGPLARTVADLEVALTVLAGDASGDPAVPPVPLGDPAAVRISDLRIAIYEDDGFFPPAPALRRAVREAAAALQARGARIETWRPPAIRDAVALYYALLGADGAAGLKRRLAKTPVDRRVGFIVRAAGLPPVLRAAVSGSMRRLGQELSATVAGSWGRRSVSELWSLVDARARYRSRFLAELDAGGFDAILCPPSPLPALTHGASHDLGPGFTYTLLYNLLGLPAGVVAATRVRAGEESDRTPGKDRALRAAARVEEGSVGLPIGVQVAGRWWREDVVLAVMGALEEDFQARPGYPSDPTGADH